MEESTMKWEDLRKSKNIQDRRSQGNTTGGGFSGGSSGLGLFALLRFLPRRLRWLGLIIVFFLVIGGGGLGSVINTDNSNVNENNQVQQVEEQSLDESSTLTDEQSSFLAAVLGSTEDFWTQEFEKETNQTYQPPQLVLYKGGTMTGCGIGQATSGPFYCSADKKVYIDPSFMQELSQKYGAPGDFAMAYVLAHEVGHHIQTELGIMQQYQQALSGKSQTDQNKLNVRMELQADYFAGAWAKYAEEQGILETGDIEEALQAANAVGDDTIQKRAQGTVVPDAFTHGSAQQRQAWFDRGYQYGDIAHGDTYNTYLDFEKE